MSELNKLLPAILLAYVADVPCTLTSDECNELSKFVARLELEIEYLTAENKRQSAELAAVKESSRWHQVENKMPEIEEMVLVVDVDIVRRGFWQYHGMEVEWRDANNRWIEVYWWHPLPALPWEVEA